MNDMHELADKLTAVAWNARECRWFRLSNGDLVENPLAEPLERLVAVMASAFDLEEKYEPGYGLCFVVKEKDNENDFSDLQLPPKNWLRPILLQRSKQLTGT